VARTDNTLLNLFPKIDPDTGKRWSVADQGRAALNEICGALNSEVHRELRCHLRAWVEAWWASGPNLKEMIGSLPDPHRMAFSFALRTLSIPTDRAMAELFLVPDYPELEWLFGKRRVWLNGKDGKQRLTPEMEAICLFSLLTVNPGCERIAGACPRCDRYYIKKRASQKVYCSHRCGNAATAVARTRERIASERSEKLDRARAAVKKWKPTAGWPDWKHSVAASTGIDLRFLTRAINKGDLVPPKKGK
jgi:hypothetical protein